MLGIILAVRLLKVKGYEGLFAKLNSGATNSVGGTSERSDDSNAYICDRGRPLNFAINIHITLASEVNVSP